MEFNNIIKQLVEVYEIGNLENISRMVVFDEVYHSERYLYNWWSKIFNNLYKNKA